MFYILSSLFCLFFTVTNYCNVSWPAAMISTSLLIGGPDFDVAPYIALLLILVFIPLEAYLYYRCLKGISYLRALCYSVVAIIITSLTVRIYMTLTNADINSIMRNPDPSYFIFPFVSSALIEFIVMRLVTGYSSKKLIVPVLSGYALTIAIAIISRLIFGLQK